MGYNSQPCLPCQLLRLTCHLHLNSNSITTCSYLVGCNYSLKRNSETLRSPTSSQSVLLVLLHSFIFSKTFGQSCSLHDFTSGFGCSLTSFPILQHICAEKVHQNNLQPHPFCCTRPEHVLLLIFVSPAPLTWCLAESRYILSVLTGKL